MQTFLPSQSFYRSAEVLDNRRLGKQRVETMQIMKAILLPNYGWKNHPAVKMWQEHPLVLKQYQDAICYVWTQRGFKDTCQYKTFQLVLDNADYISVSFPKAEEHPWWLGHDKFHDSHKSNLIRKDPEHYKKLWPDFPDDLEYFWPHEHNV